MMTIPPPDDTATRNAINFWEQETWILDIEKEVLKKDVGIAGKSSKPT